MICKQHNQKGQHQEENRAESKVDGPRHTKETSKYLTAES